MDYLDPKKKKAHDLRLFIGYILMAVALALASFILLLQAYGYDLDRHTGQIIQNGLIFIASAPVSANVYLNGTLNGHTSTKLTIPAGQYTIDLKQSGYRDWKRTFTLEGGSVEQLVYPVIFPTKLDTKDIQQYTQAPTFATESPDRHWLIVQSADATDTFDNFDLTNPTNPATTLTIPSSILTPSTGTQSMSLVEWSTDNRHVLLKHTYSGGDEFIMLDRDTPADSFNVNKLFGATPTQVALRDKRYDELYLYNAQTEALDRADVKAKQVTPFLTKVLAFKPYGSDTVLYVSDTSTTAGKVAINMWDSNKSYLIHDYPVSSSYLIDLANFSGHQYVVVSPSATGEVYIYKDPLNQAKQSPNLPPSPETVLIMANATNLSFSAIARFISVESGGHFAVYDIQTNRRYYYNLKEQVDPSQKATWMDGDRQLLILGNKTVVFDYDGINEQALAPSLPGFIPFFNSNYQLLFNVAPSTQTSGHYALTQTDLRVK